MTKEEFFPLSNQPGADSALNQEMMHDMAKNSEPITEIQFKEIYSNHQFFLENGGKGGRWQTLEVSGLTFAVYTGAKSTAGKQATFLNSNLSILTLSEVNLESTDFVNVYFENGSFRFANIRNSVLIDSVLINVDFSGANLSLCDFSRSLMMNCQFTNANLSGCDFENCDLSNSNFTGANTNGSRFPGAILENVIFS